MSAACVSFLWFMRKSRCITAIAFVLSWFWVSSRFILNLQLREAFVVLMAKYIILLIIFYGNKDRTKLFAPRLPQKAARKHTPELAFGGWSSSIKAQPQFLFKMSCMKFWWLVFEILCLQRQPCWVQVISGLSSLSLVQVWRESCALAGREGEWEGEITREKRAIRKEEN